MNKTDARIVKWWDEGCHNLERLARRLGRPGDTIRVRAALEREGRISKTEMLDDILGIMDNLLKDDKQ